MNFARLRSLLMLFLILGAASGMAADESTTTNLQAEVRLLRARLDALERQLADMSARQTAFAAPTGAVTVAGAPAEAAPGAFATTNQLACLNDKLDLLAEAQRGQAHKHSVLADLERRSERRQKRQPVDQIVDAHRVAAGARKSR